MASLVRALEKKDAQLQTWIERMEETLRQVQADRATLAPLLAKARARLRPGSCTRKSGQSSAPQVAPPSRGLPKSGHRTPPARRKSLPLLERLKADAHMCKSPGDRRALLRSLYDAYDVDGRPEREGVAARPRVGSGSRVVSERRTDSC